MKTKIIVLHHAVVVPWITAAFLFGFVFAALDVAQAQSNKFTIRSQVDTIRATEFSLTIWDGNTRAVNKGPFPLTNGQIHYEDTTSHPLVIRVSVNDKSLTKYAGPRSSFPVKSQSVWLVAAPGAEVVLKGNYSDFSAVYPYGDAENDKLRKLSTAYFPLLNDAVNISVELAAKESEMSEAEIETRKRQRAEINAKAQDILLDYLSSEPSSIGALYFMGDSYIRKFFDTKKLTEMLASVDPAYEQTIFYQSLAERVKAEVFNVGNPILEIVSSRTPDGSQFSTADWAGKFYLIDFWGSWCGPCVADFPNVKEIKAAFPDQLRILGIASDTDRSWRAAIDQHQLNWQHILIGNGDQDFATRLNVMGYPTKILVDPKGVIVYRSSGSGKESFDKMAEIIKNYK